MFGTSELCAIMTPRAEILRLYRSLLHLARLLPPQQNGAIPMQQVKEGFRQHKNETDESVIEKLVFQAQQRLGFMRITLPRHHQQKQSGLSEKRTYTFFEGKVVERPKEGPGGRSVMKNQSLDPASLERHHRLLERQQFKGDFWKGKKR